MDGSVSEFRQAEKWTKEIPLDDLSPMWADFKKAKHRHFYVKELAQLRDGAYVIPLRWVIKNKTEQAECYDVLLNTETQQFDVNEATPRFVEAHYFELNFEDLEKVDGPLRFSGLFTLRNPTPTPAEFSVTRSQ